MGKRKMSRRTKQRKKHGKHIDHMLTMENSMRQDNLDAIKKKIESGEATPREIEIYKRHGSLFD
jgi:hypothetical protein